MLTGCFSLFNAQSKFIYLVYVCCVQPVIITLAGGSGFAVGTSVHTRVGFSLSAPEAMVL